MEFMGPSVVGLEMVDWEGGRASLLAVAPSKSGTATFAKPPRRRCDELFNPVALDSVDRPAVGRLSKMASRGLRNKSTRLSSPATSATKESVSAPEPAARAKDSRKTLLDAWVEPPLRQAAPSFEDHKGLERVGVLEMMEPLGRLPTQKLLQKLKLSAPKPSPRATPGNGEEATTPTTEIEGTDTTPPARPSRRSESVRADEREIGQHSVVVKQGPDEDESKAAGAVPPSPARQTVTRPSVSMGQSPSANPPRTHMPVEHIKSHVEAAIDEANRKNSPELVPGLRRICEDADADPSLWTVLDAVLQKSPSRKQFRIFRRYLKSGLAQHSASPTSNVGPPSSLSMNNSTAVSTPTRSFPPPYSFSNSASRSSLHLRSPVTAPLPFHPQRTQSQPASPSMSPTGPGLAAATANGTFDGNTRDLPSESAEDSGAHPARSRSVSSSSSLSSAKSLDAETFAPTIEGDGEGQPNGSKAAKSAGQRQATIRVAAAAGHNNTKTRTALSSIPKGPYADFNSVNKSTTNRFKKLKIDPEVNQEEIQRQKEELLQQSIHDYDQHPRYDSSERTVVAPRDNESSVSSILNPPPPVIHPHHVHPASALPSSPIGPDAPSEHLLRNGTSRKRSRNEHEDDEDAAGTPASSSPPPFLAPPPPGATASSRASTPRFAKLPPAKKIKKSARVMHSPNKPKNGGITAGIARAGTGKDSAAGNGVDDSDEENYEYCGACGGPGELLCCDGCPNAFHGNCLEPPIDTNNPPDDQWYCPRCVARRGYGQVETSGILGRIVRRIDEINPKAFNLPFELREYFEGVKTGDEGEYEEVSLPRTQNNHPVKMNRAGFIEEPNYKELRDSKNNLIVCYRCNLTSNGRDIIPCDYCPARWHLDCLDPPLAVPPRRRKDNPNATWRCPLHIENDLATRDRQELATPGELGRMPRLRRPKHAIPYDVGLTRGYKNNGLIDVELMKDEEPTIEEVDRMGTVVRLPEKGIRLDFIDRVKRSWYEDQTFPMHLHTPKRMHDERYRPSLDLDRVGQHPAGNHCSEQREMDTSNADFHLSRPAGPAVGSLTNYNLRAKSFAEQQAVLSLRQLSETAETDGGISGTTIEELTNALITDAPPEVARAVQRDELAALVNLQNLVAKRISVVSRGEPTPELNGRHTSDAPTDIDDSMDGIS